MGKFILLVLDSVGVGELPDAHLYGDEGSNTLANTAAKVGGLNLPNLASFGLGNIIPITGVPARDDTLGAWGKMAEVSQGKDTTTGHWELAGLQLTEAFPTYPNGFPAEIITEFSQAIGRSILGNVVASGTEIIERLGEEHLKAGKPIVYTSADSVFQIAAHEQIVPVSQLYEWCIKARDILVGEHGVGRVIARPFLGQPGNFSRTANRKDFSLEPTGTTILDHLTKHNIPVAAIGKIKDVFAGRGITYHLDSKTNHETVEQTIAAMKRLDHGLVFANLVDFDMLWGHRNDYQAYAQGLEEFDQLLPTIISGLDKHDILCITADHGCDPTTPSTDHSREYVPLLVIGDQIKGTNLGVRGSFTDVAQTIAEYFELETIFPGTSFLNEARR